MLRIFKSVLSFIGGVLAPKHVDPPRANSGKAPFDKMPPHEADSPSPEMAFDEKPYRAAPAHHAPETAHSHVTEAPHAAETSRVEKAAKAPHEVRAASAKPARSAMTVPASHKGPRKSPVAAKHNGTSAKKESDKSDRKESAGSKTVKRDRRHPG